MRRSIVASVSLSLGLIVASANAQDFQWRPASATPANPATVGLMAPMANSTPIRQVSLTQPVSDAPVVRAKINDASGPGQPLPVGAKPTGPVSSSPFPVVGSTPSADATSSNVISSWVSIDSVEPNPISNTSITSPAVVVDSGATGCVNGPRSRRMVVSDAPFYDGISGDAVCCDPCNGAVVCDCCGCGNGCAPRSVFYMSGEYLLWTVKKAPAPDLVTANSQGDIPALGLPGTSTLIGGEQSYNIRSGGRFTIGGSIPSWFGDLGLEGTVFFLGQRSATQSASGDGTQVIGRPFTDVGPAQAISIVTGQPLPGNRNAELVSFPPGLLTFGFAGKAQVYTTNNLWGTEANFRLPMMCNCNSKMDFLFGFRQLQLTESLAITEDLNVLAPTFFAGSSTPIVATNTVLDSFETKNNFYGGQIGFDCEYRWRRWTIDATGKLAMGDMNETVTINGSNTVANAGFPPVTSTGGLLAQPSNIGQHSQDQFCIIPELTLKLGFNFTTHLRGYVGYDILYISNVVRPGDQIDTRVNSTFLPGNGPLAGPASPEFAFHTTDFWAQGVLFGLELRY